MADIAGIFETRADAERAVNTLTAQGIDPDDISLLMSGTAREDAFGGEDLETRAANAGMVGLGIGGVLGALVAGLTAVSTVIVPGGILAVGPMVATLSGAGIGALVGGLGAALVRAGIDEQDAEDYEAALKDGKIVVILHAATEEEEEAALRAFGDVRQRAA